MNYVERMNISGLFRLKKKETEAFSSSSSQKESCTVQGIIHCMLVRKSINVLKLKPEEII